MTIPINKLNLASNSKFLSKSRLTSLDHLQKWGLSINSSLSNIQKEWNNTTFPLLNSLPQIKEVDAWANGFDGKAVYVDNSAEGPNNKLYDSIKDRPKTIEESIEDSLVSLDKNNKEIESLKNRINNVKKRSDNSFSISGDATGVSSSVTVEKILNRDLSEEVPPNNYSLAWDDSESYWTPISKTGDPPYPPGYVSGLNMYTPLQGAGTFEVLIETGACRSDDDTTNIILSEELELVPTANMDTGTHSGTKHLFVWLFYNPSTEDVTVKFSLQYPGSGTDPTAPAGYTKKRYIGNVLMRKWGIQYYIREFHQTGSGSVKTYFYEESHDIMLEGSATTWTTCSASHSEFEISLTGAILTPVTANLQLITVGTVLRGTSQTMYARSQGSSSTSGSILHVGRYTVTPCTLNVLGDRNIEYKAGHSDARCNVEIQGYIESL